MDCAPTAVYFDSAMALPTEDNTITYTSSRNRLPCYNFHVCRNTTTCIKRKAIVDLRKGESLSEPLCPTCSYYFGTFLDIVHFFGWEACDHCFGRKAVLIRVAECKHQLCRTCFVYQSGLCESNSTVLPCLACTKSLLPSSSSRNSGEMN